MNRAQLLSVLAMLAFQVESRALVPDDALHKTGAKNATQPDARYFPQEPLFYDYDPESRLQIPLQLPLYRIPGWPALANRFDAAMAVPSSHSVTGTLRGFANYCYGMLCRLRKALHL